MNLIALNVDFPRLMMLQDFIGGCFNSGLSPDSLVNLIQFKLSIDEGVTTRNKLTIVLMQENGIYSPVRLENGKMAWVYDDLPNAKQISAALDAINRKKFDISPCNFMSKEEFHAFTAKENSRREQPLTMEQIAFLSKYLLKN